MSKKKTTASLIVSLVSMLAVVIFLIIGFTSGVWHPTWLIFMAIPIVSLIANIVTDRKDIPGIVSGTVSLVCGAGYLLMGFLWNLWHPGWIIFFLIPISGIITSIFSRDRTAPETSAQAQENPSAEEKQPEDISPEE